MNNDIIIALATSSGQSGAIAVIRISGEKCISLANMFVDIDLMSRKDHTVNFCKIFDEEKNIIDEVLISLFFKDHSYTKEESMEISCHNSQYIIRSILDLFLRHGARIANHGEFTQRAFLNGRFDLTQAEAVCDIISAKSKAAHDVALKQMNGYVSDYINSIKQEIIDISSEIELQNDFSEEQFIDEDDKSEYKIIDKIDNIILQLKDILKNFHQGEIIKKGLPIAIVGKPNVGKSSLLNILCNEDRAIVSPIAGTTRDTIDIEVNIGDIVCRFIDTAGLRDDYKDEIEKIGIERSKKTIEKAQLVIFVVDVTMKEKDYIEDLNFIKKFNNDIVIVVNKIDLDEKYKTNFDNTIYVSAKKNINISKIKEYIKSKYKIREDEVVVNSRHFIVLNNILNILLKLKVDCQKNIPSEILMINIKEIIELLNTITGKTTSENILNNIFSNFCIGK